MSKLLYRYFLFYPVHICTIICLFFVDYSLVNFLIFLLGWTLLHGFGAEVTIHRALSHRAFKIKKVLFVPLLWLASLCLQGPALHWAALHRNHHKNSDTDKDDHSPVNGLWHSYHGWTSNWDKLTRQNLRYTKDLLRIKEIRFFAKHNVLIVYGTYLVFFLISPNLLFWLLMLPATVSLIQNYNINMFCHLSNFGYTNYKTRDNSRNIVLLGLTSWGLGWHNNHHHRPGAWDMGSGVSGKWYEIDPAAKLLIPLVKE